METCYVVYPQSIQHMFIHTEMGGPSSHVGNLEESKSLHLALSAGDITQLYRAV